MENLTTLENLKAWGNISSASNDAMLARMISAVSRSILNYLQRTTCLKTSITRTMNGSGSSFMVLPDFPVLSIQSLSINGVSVSAAANAQNSGYMLEPWSGYLPGAPQTLNLNGYAFSGYSGNNGSAYRNPGGQLNVIAQYFTGYAVVDESQTAAALVKVDAPQGRMAQDDGVTMAGVAMTKVAIGTTPTTGQYALSANGGEYVFAAADAGNTVLISYSYIPADIEQAAIEWILERYSYKARIGQTSQSLGGQETASFSLAGMPDFIKITLQPYKKVLFL